MKSKINRNDPCPCGSGKKYKNCHEDKQTKNKSKIPLILGIILIVTIGIFILKPNQDLKSSGGKPGQVWSEEHGHWHDAPATPVTPTTPSQAKSTQQQGPASSNTPAQAKSTRPLGPAPEGKVWSEEHGHWHNASTEPATSSTPAQVKSTRPPGPAPEGKVWSEEHGHWHNAPTTEQSENQ
jgi:hypothetical protein